LSDRVNETGTSAAALAGDRARPRARPATRADNMARIIEAASALFAAQGFAGTSMEQVASTCQAGKDTIYRRFPSKLALFGAVLEHAHGRWLAELNQFTKRLPKDGDPLDRLKRVARWFLEVNLDPQLVAFKRISITESFVFAGKIQPGGQDDPFMTLLMTYVAAAQDAGQIAAGDRWFIASQLVHSVVSLPLNETLVGSTALASKVARDRHFKKAWGLFLSGAAAR
jgi:TetR/AcrR family transcriptional regulator, regulator of autoinduction and epiphytic fitness